MPSTSDDTQRATTSCTWLFVWRHLCLAFSFLEYVCLASSNKTIWKKCALWPLFTKTFILLKQMSKIMKSFWLVSPWNWFKWHQVLYACLIVTKVVQLKFGEKNEKRGNMFWTKFAFSGHSGKYFCMGEVAEVLRSNSTYDVVVCASRISLYSLYHGST